MTTWILLRRSDVPPDGIGMYWYGSEEEARGDVEPVKATRMFDTHKEFDETFGR